MPIWAWGLKAIVDVEAGSNRSTVSRHDRCDTLRADSPVYSREEAAAYLNLRGIGVPDPVAGVDRLVKTRKLKSFNLLGRRAFTRDQLDRCIELLRKEANNKQKVNNAR